MIIKWIKKINIEKKNNLFIISLIFLTNLNTGILIFHLFYDAQILNKIKIKIKRIKYSYPNSTNMQ